MLKSAFSLLCFLSLFAHICCPALGQTPTPTRSADIVVSGRVDTMDLFFLSSGWKSGAGTPRGDIDGDGKCCARDLLLLLWAWHTDGTLPTPTPIPHELTIVLPNLPAGARPMRLVHIPGGSFQMGSPAGERGRNDADEGPVHTVTIATDFYIGETEVTQAQWKALMGNNPARDYGVGNDYPVYYMPGNDVTKANGFLDRLSALGYGTFRLPTEAEWEYACRGSASSPNRYARFSFGDNLDCEDDDCDNPCPLADQYMVWCVNAGGQAKEVASRLPNDYGLYDMHGNLWEWCQDWYQEDFYGQPGATLPDPLCSNPASGEKVFRSGYWTTFSRFCRSATRGKSDPSAQFVLIGFRVVLPIPSR
jgi:formylglycine-generating enzyme required for sulfatase activity